MRKTIEPVPQPERRRHLRPQARQGGRRARLAAAGRRARAQGARLPSLARHLVRACDGRARSRCWLRGLALAGGAPGTVSVGARRLSDGRLRRRRLEAPEAAAARQGGASGRRLPARLCACRPARCCRRPPSCRCRQTWPTLTPCRATSSPSNTTAAPFVGWQRQDNGPSVQAALEDAVFAFSGERVHRCRAPGAPMPASMRWARWRISISRTRSRAETVRGALNFHLKPQPDRRASRSEIVPAGFHARFSATWRRYRYRILNRRAPPALDRGHVWHVPVPLDMPTPWPTPPPCCIGHHDFNSFRSVVLPGASRRSRRSTCSSVDAHAARRSSIDVGAALVPAQPGAHPGRHAAAGRPRPVEQGAMSRRRWRRAIARAPGRPRRRRALPDGGALRA